MEHVEEQTKSWPTRPRLRVKKAHAVTVITLFIGVFLLPWWWWVAVVTVCLILHLMLTIGHWYEISELLWEENLDLTVERDQAVKRAERAEEANVQLRRRQIKTVDVPLLSNGPVPPQRRGGDRAW